MADRHDRLRSFVALGLVVASKWDQADTRHDGEATPAQATQFDTFTDAQTREFNERAAAMLAEYAASIASRRRPSFWLPVLQSLVAALIYSVFVVIMFLLVKFGGRDLIDIAREALTRPS